MMTIAQKDIPALLSSHFSNYIQMPIELWEGFSTLGTIKRFKKNEVIKRAHTKEKYMHFLIEGNGGIMLWGAHNYVCVDLCFQGEALCDYMSFTMEKPSPIEVIVFEDTQTFSIPRDNFRKIYEAGAHGEKITRIVAESAFIEKQEQQIDLLTLSAAERYDKLLETKKEQLARIPHKYIASYLGITPQSFSRLKKNAYRR